jgi:hypothetical protein
MNHPNPDEWVPFLFDEAEPNVREELRRHLDGCPECRLRLYAWRHSLKRLDHWRLPPIARSERRRLTLVPWAAAAAVVLSLGLIFAGISTVRAKQARLEMERSLKTALVAQIKDEINREVNGRFQQQLADARQQIRREIQSQIAGELDRVVAASLSASSSEIRRQLAEFALILNRVRETDRQETVAAWRQMQTQQATDYLALRHDLETVAAQTDRELRRDRFNLAQLNLAESEWKESKP